MSKSKQRAVGRRTLGNGAAGRWCLPALAAVALAVAPAAFAATIPKEMVEALLPACQEMVKAKLDPDAPADPKKIDAYCNCTTTRYYASVPQKDFDAMNAEQGKGDFAGPGSQAVSAKLEQRMAAARKQCK
jgi:hypothetical protein